jgi:hypothetical protein
MIIYILEAFILWQYCSDLFSPAYSRITEGIAFLIAYSLLFCVSFCEIFWLNLLAFLVVDFVIIRSLYCVKWHTALFHSTIIAIIMSLSELAVFSVLMYFSPGYYATSSYFRNLTILAVFSKLIYFFVLRLISRFFHNEKEKNGTPDSETFLLTVVPFITLCVMVTLVAVCLHTTLSLALDWMISISAMLLLVLNILIFWIYKTNQRKNDAFISLQLQLQKECDSAEYYSMLLKQDENQKILIHDIKKHLQSIAILNKKGEQQDVSDYIDHMLQSADLQSSARICDNELLNTILCRYMNTCQQKKISFHADIRKRLLDFLDYDDLTALFCNLLDNAVEASSDISGAYIDLSVTYHEAAGFTVITMINSCSKNPFSEKTGKLLSRKKDTLRHGYGMKSVQKIAQKYSGTMQTYYDVNMEFHTIITLK